MGALLAVAADLNIQGDAIDRDGTAQTTPKIVVGLCARVHFVRRMGPQQRSHVDLEAAKMATTRDEGLLETAKKFILSNNKLWLARQTR
ncbi:hypothetical protein L1987_54727 [Smallanthus sonchifolius]|uniref:Uncharacterized protein n=1 Tax=Smallanthus sonchifolius TaxID=185202 RepID=A0ACB9E7T0_9ASTR|nr:hypothetical protein L1987_54727 [Smallanthus sonchifolius]